MGSCVKRASEIVSTKRPIRMSFQTDPTTPDRLAFVLQPLLVANHLTVPLVKRIPSLDSTHQPNTGIPSHDTRHSTRCHRRRASRRAGAATGGNPASGPGGERTEN